MYTINPQREIETRDNAIPLEFRYEHSILLILRTVLIMLSSQTPFQQTQNNQQTFLTETVYEE